MSFVQKLAVHIGSHTEAGEAIFMNAASGDLESMHMTLPTANITPSGVNNESLTKEMICTIVPYTYEKDKIQLSRTP